MPVDALRDREALEDAAVAELEHVVALGVGLCVELLDLAEEGLGIGELVEDVRRAALVVARLEDTVGYAPHLGEPSVAAGDASVGVDHEDAVGGRVERRMQQGQRRAELGLGGDALGDVVGGDDVAADGRIVEQVDDRELQRDGRVARGRRDVDGDRRSARPLR